MALSNHNSSIYCSLHTPAPASTNKQSSTRSMNTNEASASTAIALADAPIADVRAKAPAPLARKVPFFAFFRKTRAVGGSRRGLAVLDLVLRLCAIGATLAAAVVMGTSDETLPFVTEHYQFYASYADLPSLTFFVIGNAIAAGYLVLSLPISIFRVVCPHTVGARFLLFLSDLVMVALTTAAGSAAASIVYLAHTGSSKANWVAICLRFDDFCQQISGAVVASFVGTFILMLMVVLSAISLHKHHASGMLVRKN